MQRLAAYGQPIDLPEAGKQAGMSAQGGAEGADLLCRLAD